MSKIFLALLIIPTFLSFRSSEKTVLAKGFKYVSEDKKLSMVFPAEFTQSVEKNESSTTIKVTSTKDNISYFIGWTKHETPLEDPKLLTEVSLEAFSESIGGKAVNKEKFTYKKDEGISSKIFIEDKGVCLYYVIIIGQNQFQLIAISLEDKFGKDTDNFFKSFKYKK